jgi:hypothetical protein
MDDVPQSRPFDAWDGGAKVLGAIREVLKYGGSIERALDAGQRALDDLRPKSPSPPHDRDR